MFEKYKLNSAASRLIDEQFYEQVVNELAQGVKKNGLWAKALANSDGAEEKATALYIKYRVQSIKDEVTVSEAVHKIESEIADEISKGRVRKKDKKKTRATHESSFRTQPSNYGKDIPSWDYAARAQVINANEKVGVPDKNRDSKAGCIYTVLCFMAFFIAAGVFT